MAALTAMATGVPVVTFEGFPASEIVVHGESGYVVQTVEEASRAVERLGLLRPELGRSRARIAFDAATAAVQHEALYNQLASGNRPAFRHPETDPDIQQSRLLERQELAAPIPA
jgi:glycosyltransferase involved in cell wall biosynthesis